MNGITYTPPQYPINAFPVMIREAALEIQRNIQAPDAMIAMALEAAMSLACQGLVDVKLPTGQIRPCTLNFLCVGESGERKSTIDALVFAPFYGSDRAAAIAHHSAIDKQSNHNHADAMKQAKRLRRFMRQNITARAIMDALEGDGESIAIATDEGQLLFKSGAFSNFGLLNKAWDGPELLTIDRAGFDHLLVMNPRVTVSIMTQLEPLQAFLKTRGALGRGSGHFARYLVGQPASTQGFRETTSVEFTWERLFAFNTRTSDLLALYLERVKNGPVTRDLVEFSADASDRWRDLTSDLEWQLRPGQYLHDIRDFASKVVEIVGRLAALFHYHSGEHGRVTLDTLDRAAAVVWWHLYEYKRLFAAQALIPQDIVDAHALVQYLRTHVWRGPASNTFTAKTKLLQNGPVRRRDRLNAALDLLVYWGAVVIGVAPVTKQKFVTLVDLYFMR